jgi:IMP dehydrogenase
MAHIINEISRTFNEYLLIPGLTTKECTPANVNLQTPLVKFKKGETPSLSLNVPFTSAIMQSVSDSNMAIALAKNGGISFIYGSQSIDDQAEMVRKVKKYKAGFVVSDANLTPENTLADVVALKAKTGYSTIGITDDGTSNGKLLGIVTSRDYRPTRDPQDRKVKEFMTPFEKLIVGH